MLDIINIYSVGGIMHEDKVEKRRFNPERVQKKGIKKGKHYRIAGSALVAGAIIIFGLGVATSQVGGAINDKFQESRELELNSNVCVEYEVQPGDTKGGLNEIFKDIGSSYLAVSGSARNSDLLYVGDVIIGRTTKEIAEELENRGIARIITIDEAVEILGENHSLIGRFREYANGNRDYVFYVPTGKTLS